MALSVCGTAVSFPLRAQVPSGACDLLLAGRTLCGWERVRGRRKTLRESAKTAKGRKGKAFCKEAGKRGEALSWLPHFLLSLSVRPLLALFAPSLFSRFRARKVLPFPSRG